MKTLSDSWFSEGYIDFELKKYTLLAYLQQVNQFFNQKKLYPQLADVIFQYNNLLHFKHNKEYLKNQFPKRLSHPDLQKLELLYESMIEDDEMMQELEAIIFYALKKFKKTIEGGTEIYEFVEKALEIEPIGLVPLECNEGYILLKNGASKLTKVYQYRLSNFEKREEKYRSLKTEFIADWQQSFVNSCENIKAELIRNRSFMPNPAVYCIATNLKIPLEETLLPVAKRSFSKYLTEQG